MPESPPVTSAVLQGQWRQCQAGNRLLSLKAGCDWQWTQQQGKQGCTHTVVCDSLYEQESTAAAAIEAAAAAAACIAQIKSRIWILETSSACLWAGVNVHMHVVAVATLTLPLNLPLPLYESYP